MESPDADSRARDDTKFAYVDEAVTGLRSSGIRAPTLSRVFDPSSSAPRLREFHRAKVGGDSSADVGILMNATQLRPLLEPLNRNRPASQSDAKTVDLGCENPLIYQFQQN